MNSKKTDLWYKDIQNEMTKLQNMCKTNNSEYNFEKNPFSNKDINTFRKLNPRKIQRCKDQSDETDKMNRYYKYIRSNDGCKKHQGVWNEKSISREDKYGKGVCWTTNEDSTCSNYIDDKLIIPYPDNGLSKESKIVLQTKNKSKCIQNNSCLWKNNDCVSKDNYYEHTNTNTNNPPKKMPKDIVKEDANIQTFLYDWYTNKKYGNPPETSELISTENRCIDSSNKKTMAQSVVNMIMKNIQLQNSSNKGLLAWHSTGSGKTCTATGVMEAFWKSNRQIIFVSSIDALTSNPPFKFHDCASKLYQWTDDVKDAFEKRFVMFKTFAKMANCVLKSNKLKQILKIKELKEVPLSVHVPNLSNINILINYLKNMYDLKQSTAEIKLILQNLNMDNIEDFVDLDNSILIVDEVHNLFRPLPAQKAKHKYLEDQITENTNLKIVILTATPGDNVTDIIKLLNIVRDPNTDKILQPDSNLSAFKESIRGLISYFDMNNDTSKFPTINEEISRYPMSMKQFDKYVEAYKKVPKNLQDFEYLSKKQQLNKLWQGARKYSNMLYTFDKSLKLTEFSSKLPGLLENILKYPNEKHYIYSAFHTKQGSGQGIYAIAKELEKIGYTKDTGKKTKHGKHYMIATRTDIKNVDFDKLVAKFNSSENKNGDLIQIFLASQNFNEGIDLKAVRHIHIFEPLVNMALEYQTIGRARRYCSHSDLDKADWNVKIHKYISDLPMEFNVTALHKEANELEESIANLKKEDKKELAEKKKRLKDVAKELKAIDVINIDEFIYNETKSQFLKLLNIHHAMMEMAVDCRLFNKFHNRIVKCST